MNKMKTREEDRKERQEQRRTDKLRREKESRDFKELSVFGNGWNLSNSVANLEKRRRSQSQIETYKKESNLIVV